MDKEDTVYIYKMEYCSALKKELLSLATTWIKLEEIILIEISHRKKKTALSPLYVEYKKVEYIEADRRRVVAKGGEMEEMETCWSKRTKLL